MQRHKPVHVLDDLGRVPQLPHPLSCHLGPDDVMVVEVDPSGPDRARQGLADVVEQGRQTERPFRAGLLDDSDRVGKHVLVPLNRVLL